MAETTTAHLAKRWPPLPLKKEENANSVSGKRRIFFNKTFDYLGCMRLILVFLNKHYCQFKQ